jgi:hypothetical protein
MSKNKNIKKEEEEESREVVIEDTKGKKCTRTFEELKNIDLVVGAMYKIEPTLRETRFGYGYKRFADKHYYKLNKEYLQKLVDIRIDNALTDEVTKELIIDNNPNSRGFKYGKEGFKALIKAERALEESWDNQVVEIEPYIIKKEDLPKLTDVQKDLFKGILI